eukprot:c19373_g1_i2.p1 GENE.c19373_g1_i2~~c19373_g1_i2.p1  ORF type:complete len:485 (-),score=92.24 c19373_g1_i2:30-1484(-)
MLAVSYFVGTIPTEIGRLTNTLELRLDDNRLSGTMCSELGQLLQLSRASFNDNKFTSTLPSELENLSNLLHLDISDNLIFGSIPSMLKSFTQLVELTFDSNRLTGTIPSQLFLLNKLERIGFRGNSISGTIPTEFGLLNKLVRVRLDFNQLSGTFPTELGLVYATINVSYNYLSGPVLFNANKSYFFCNYSGLIDPICYKDPTANSTKTTLDLTFLLVGSIIMCFLMFLITVVAILIFKNRTKPIIKATNYIFSILSLFGLFLLSFSVIPYGFTLSETSDIHIRDISCIAFPHFMIHGIVLLLSCITAKSYPIWRCFNNPTLAKISIKAFDLLKFVSFTLSISVGIVVPLSVNSFAHSNDFGCGNTNIQVYQYLQTIIIVYVCLLAILTCWISIKIRNAPARYNDTNDIGIATYTLLANGVVMIVVTQSTTNPTPIFIAICILVIVSVLAFVVLVYVSKLTKLSVELPQSFVRWNFRSKSDQTK